MRPSYAVPPLPCHVGLESDRAIAVVNGGCRRFRNREGPGTRLPVVGNRGHRSARRQIGRGARDRDRAPVG